MINVTLQDIQTALNLTSFDTPAAHQLMAPLNRQIQRPKNQSGNARVGSVLLLLYCHRGSHHLALTRRRDDLNSHAGQISFPGGKHEPGETIKVAALRETYEEIGVPPTAVTLIGDLTTIWIPPSDFRVHPFVGWVHSGARPSFTLAKDEVAELLEVPLTHLLNPAARKEGPMQIRGAQFTVPYFDVEGYKVWGATAVMLSEFIERLRVVIKP
ncbi:MAG: CoA pyrophosphatase [Chloroflexi bacterium]|nr:CoA pyrophosphatase [Chloroflexota bacterium]